MWVMPRDLQKAAQAEEVNWAPLSEVKEAGTPKPEIQEVRAAMQSAAEVDRRG